MSNNNQKNFKVFKDSFYNRNRYGNIFLASFVTLIGLISLLLTVLWKNNLVKNNLQIILNKSLFNIKFGQVVFVLSFIFILFGLFYFLVIKLNVIKREFRVYPHKIESFYQKIPETEVLFSDISQVYRFRRIKRFFTDKYGTTNCLAYRKDSKDLWKVVLPTLKEMERRKLTGVNLEQAIVEGYVQNNLERNYLDLQNSKVISFEYFIDVNNEAKNEFDKILLSLANKKLKDSGVASSAKNLNNLKTKKIILEKDSIIYNNNKIFFAFDDSIYIGEYEVIKGIISKVDVFEKAKIFQLYDKDGGEKLSIDLINVINSDLFIELSKKVLDDIVPVELQNEPIVYMTPENELENIPDETENILVETENIPDEPEYNQNSEIENSIVEEENNSDEQLPEVEIIEEEQLPEIEIAEEEQ